MNWNMELKFVPEFTVMGKLGQGEASNGPSWVLPLWDSLNRNLGEIQRSVEINPDTGAPKGCWGVMGRPGLYLGRWTEVGQYLAGMEVSKDAPVPEGWTKWTVPEQTYLVCTCTQEEYGTVFPEMLNRVLPEYGLEMIGACHEFYPDPKNPDQLQLFFPIAAGRLFCQSCGMPLENHEQVSKNADGKQNYDYCVYCYDKGAFTSECSMEEMIEFCLNCEGASEFYPDKDKARQEMTAWFPTLKRWKKV